MDNVFLLLLIAVASAVGAAALVALVTVRRLRAAPVVPESIQAPLTEQRERATRAEIALESAQATLTEQRERTARAESALETTQAALTEQRERTTRAEASLEAAQDTLTEQRERITWAESTLETTQAALTEQRERTARAESALDAVQASLAEHRTRAAQEQVILTASLEAAQAALAEQCAHTARAETALETAQAAHAEKIAALQDAEQRLRDTFASLSSDALKASSEHFLRLAEERIQRHQQAAKTDLTGLVEPLRETLVRQEQQVRALEEARQTAYGSLDALLKEMRQGQSALQSETGRLVNALGRPQLRGRWGELQLERLVELAGMQAHCDFGTQVTVTGDEGQQRLDMLVRLPNQRCIVIDAKVPVGAFDDALQVDERQRPERLKIYARQVRDHIDTMAKRGYHKVVEGAYEFTVIFIPGELFYHAALEYDHTLLDYALGKGVVLASPNTLIALLKSAAMGWREAQIAADARKIQQLGAEVYERLGTVAGHLSKLGKSLTQSVDAYNASVGSIENRLLASARRMHSMGIGTAPPPDLTLVSETVRLFSQPELLPQASSALSAAD
jgi:DNA recombination protein RmuC